MRRYVLIPVLAFALVLTMGCMSLVNGAGSAVGAVTSTTATAAKAGGTVLKDAASATMKYASGVWRQASAGHAPEDLEPSAEP